MQLTKKDLIIHNQRRIKEHLRKLANDGYREVEKIVKNENLTLEQRQKDNVDVFKRAYARILEKELKIHK